MSRQRWKKSERPAQEEERVLSVKQHLIPHREVHVHMEALSSALRLSRRICSSASAFLQPRPNKVLAAFQHLVA